jgi:hypothetical protein
MCYPDVVTCGITVAAKDIDSAVAAVDHGARDAEFVPSGIGPESLNFTNEYAESAYEAGGSVATQ